VVITGVGGGVGMLGVTNDGPGTDGGTVGAVMVVVVGNGAMVSVTTVSDGVGSVTATFDDTDGAFVVSFCACARTTDGDPARRKIIARY